MCPPRLLLMYLLWWVAWSFIQGLLLLQAGWSWPIALPDALLSNFLIILAGYAIGLALRFYQPDFRQALSLLAWSTGLAVLCMALVYGVLSLFHPTDGLYLSFVKYSMPLRFASAWLMLSLMMLANWLWFYWQEQQEAGHRKEANDRMIREAELSKLRQQLQPHFLFNSLNSISALVVSKPQQARQMIQQLSDFLRSTLRKEEQQMVSLQEELKQLQLYLDIEKVRFGHRLQTIIEQEEGCQDMLLPALLLQPVVENAIKFGLYDTTGPATIRLQAKVLGNSLLLTTENPFDPLTALPRAGTGFGLRSVQRRLYLLFARHDLLSTWQEQEIFITQLQIPQTDDKVPPYRRRTACPQHPAGVPGSLS